MIILFSSQRKKMSTDYAEYDLHLHSHWSYDACAPVEYYFQLASQFQPRAIAITEHFTMDSLPDVVAASKKYPDVRFIAGAEMTVLTSAGSIDMVCLGLPLDTPPELEALFDRYRQWQHKIGKAISEAWKKLGIDYTEEERLFLLRQYRAEKNIAKQGVTHVNNTVQTAYWKKRGMIAEGEDLYEKLKMSEFPKYPAASEVLPVIRKHGGVIFIAHPLYYFKRDDVKTMDALREELGFDGIECAHTMIPPELTSVYRKYCLEHKLLSSGGSDCHSDPPHYHFNISTECEFRRHCGESAWLDEILERVKLY